MDTRKVQFSFLLKLMPKHFNISSETEVEISAPERTLQFSTSVEVRLLIHGRSVNSFSGEPRVGILSFFA